jgi:bacillolysin
MIRSTAASQARAPSSALPASPSVGPLALESPQAQEAIGRSIDHLAENWAGRDGTTPELRPFSVERDALGMLHVRLDRFEQGLPVFGEDVIVHLGSDGQVRSTTGALAPLLFAEDHQQSPRLRGADAERIARSHFTKAEGTRPGTDVKSEALFFADEQGQLRRGFRVVITDLSARSPYQMNYFVDGVTGDVVSGFDALPKLMPDNLPVPVAGQTAPRPAPQVGGPGTGASLYYGNVPLATSQDWRGRFVLEDPTRGGSKTRADLFGILPRPVRDDNDTWGESTDSSRQTAAIDAHFGLQMTWDFWKDTFGRAGIDGISGPMIGQVHSGFAMNNAYWNGYAANFGDGDGQIFGPLVSLDTVAHEYAHGLTSRTSRLIYLDQSGALNESMSDVMGVGAEWYAQQQNPAVKMNWMIGEYAWTPGTPGDAMRYMNDPKRDNYSVDHLSEYALQPEVHGASGIPNNAFYLLTEGGRNRTSGRVVEHGIGIEKSLQIFYRALAHYYTQRTSFSQARQATLQAATDLYGAGSTEVETVKQAWSAVGVE